MVFKATVTFLLVVVTVCSSLCRGEQPGGDVQAYSKTVAPLITKYCADCHGGDAPEADLSLTKIDPDLLGGDELETWRMIAEQIRFGDMPPRDAEQPSADERTAVLNWVQSELRKTQMPGVATQKKLLLPKFGNYVDHEFLFEKRLPRVYPAPPRVWRLRPDIYNSLVPRLGENISGLANALNSSDGSEFKDFSAPYFLDEASTQQLFANAKMVAAKLVSPKSKDKVLKQLVSEEAPPTIETIQAAIETAFRKALGRGPTINEKQRFLQLYQKSAEIGDAKTAATAMLTAVLLKPEFMFRQELGDGEPDKYNRVRLTQREIGYALSYALANLPLDEFTNAAEKDELATRDQIRDLVRQRLQDDSEDYSKNPRMLQFFREYFHYPNAEEVFKDTPPGGEHKPSSLVADLEMTIIDILKEDEQVLASLLTTRKFYVNAKYGRKQEAGKIIKRDTKSRKYQTAFNLPLDWKWSADLQPVEFRADERAGVLTHPAWLAAWSGNFDNHPVQRGKWVRTHLLGGSVPDVPIGVDARVPEKEHITFRNRLKVATADARCWRCHKKMDPLGVAFERYDHYGRFQRFDAGQPVDATAEISRTPVYQLHKNFSGPTEMMETLGNSEYVEQVFVRHVFRYFMGRNETLGDANTLQDAHQAYRQNNGSFNELVVSLLSSDSFLLRQLPNSKSESTP